MNTYRIYQNVHLEKDCQIGDFAIIGLPPKGYREGELSTYLGKKSEIQSHAVIYAGNTFGEECLIGHSVYMRHNNRIGHRVTIGAISVLESQITLEDDVYLASQAGISDGTIIEQGSWVGSQTMFTSVLHPLCPKAKECEKGPHLYRGVTVGSNVTIYPDLRLGEGCYIQAGSVVTRDVRPFMVMAGNPAVEIGDIFTVQPKILERVGRYLDLSSSAVTEIRTRFEQHPSLFPPR